MLYESNHNIAITADRMLRKASKQCMQSAIQRYPWFRKDRVELFINRTAAIAISCNHPSISHK